MTKLKWAAALLSLLLAVSAVLGLTAFRTTPARPSATTTTAPCVRYPSHDAFLCVRALSGDGALYWMDTLFIRSFYWHPAPGDPVVTENYYCHDNPTTADGHTDCIGDAPGVPAGSTEYTRRVISLADGCTIWGWNVLSTTASPPPPEYCVLPSGAKRDANALEKESVLDFWRIMRTVPGQW